MESLTLTLPSLGKWAIQEPSKPIQPQKVINKKYRPFLHLSFWPISTFIQFSIIVNIKPADEALIRSVINTICLAALFYTTRLLIKKYYDQKKISSFLIFEGLLVLGLIFSKIISEILYFGHLVYSNDSINLSNLLSNISILAFTSLASIFFALLFSFYFIGQKRNALEQANRHLKFENLENQMGMLNNQLSSHFLFNSLNDIYAAAILKNHSTPEMVLKLSEIMRFITYDANLTAIPFVLEITQARNYLYFFQLKNKHPVKINFNIDANNYCEMVMPMLLIPLIENALKHGNLNDLELDTILKIDISTTNNQLKIIVGNSYQFETPKNHSNGLGIVNYKKRLELRYPNLYVLNTNTTTDYFETTLTLSL